MGAEIPFSGTIKNSENDIFRLGDRFQENSLEITGLNFKNDSVNTAGALGQVTLRVTLSRLKNARKTSYDSIQKEYNILISSNPTASPLEAEKCLTIYDNLSSTTIAESCASLGGVYDGVVEKCDFSGAGSDPAAAATTKMIDDGNFATNLVKRDEVSIVDGNVTIPTSPTGRAEATEFCLKSPNHAKCLANEDGDCGPNGYVLEYNVFGELTEGLARCNNDLDCGSKMVAGFQITGQPDCKSVGTTDPLNPCPNGRSTELAADGSILCLPDTNYAYVNNHHCTGAKKYTAGLHKHYPFLDLMCDEDVNDFLKERIDYPLPYFRRGYMFSKYADVLGSINNRSLGQRNIGFRGTGCGNRVKYDEEATSVSITCSIPISPPYHVGEIFGYTCAGKEGEDLATTAYLKGRYTLTCSRSDGNKGIRASVYCCQ